MELSYQSQLKYRYSAPLEFGIQAFGKFGTKTKQIGNYPDQLHRVGPVLLGHVPISGPKSLSYNAALLFGTTGHSPDRTLRFQVEYQF